MLILIYGDDFKKKTLKVKSVLKFMQQQRKEALFLHFDYLDISTEKLIELTQIAGLFEQKNIILLSNIFKDTDLKKFFLDNLNIFEKSDNAFILTEDNLTPALIKKIAKVALKTYAFPFKKSEINIFSLSDYLQKRDKKKLWLFYRDSLKRGVKPEEFFGVLMWSLKILAVADNFSEKDSGLKTYSYKKAYNSLQNWQNINRPLAKPLSPPLPDLGYNGCFSEYPIQIGYSEKQPFRSKSETVESEGFCKRSNIEKKLYSAILMLHNSRLFNKNFEHSLEKFILEL